jgi:hypothetical protein
MSRDVSIAWLFITPGKPDLRDNWLPLSWVEIFFVKIQEQPGREK